MPPQIGGPGDPGTTVNTQPIKIEEPKTAEVDKKPAQKQEPPKQDAETAAKNAEAAKQHANDTKHQETARAQMLKNHLDKKLPEKNNGKGATTVKPEQRKPSANQPDTGAWGFVKDVARLASNTAGAGVEMLRETTANAAAVNVAEKANGHVMYGINKAREITLGKKGDELAVELKRVASGKPTFEESERMIQKIDAFKREVDSGGNVAFLQPLYTQQIVKPTGTIDGIKNKPVNSMEDLLGVYGYNDKRESYTGQEPGRERVTPYEILDTALHNWRATPVEERRKHHGYGTPPAILPDGWKTPIETKVQNQNMEARQHTWQEEPRGNRMGYPIEREREAQTDPEIALRRGQKDLVDAEAAILASIGLPEGGASSPQVAEPIGPARAPHRGAPPEPISVAETQPRQAKSTLPPSSEPVAVASKAEQAPKTETKQNRVPKNNAEEPTKHSDVSRARESKTNRMSKPPDEIDREIKEAEDAARGWRKEAEGVIRDRTKDGRVGLEPNTTLNEKLRELAEGGDDVAEAVLRELEQVQARLQDLRRQRAEVQK